jgi:hypothetical protein
MEVDTMLLATKLCFICNKPLTSLPEQRNNLCDHPQCRWNYARIPSHQICAVCGRPLSVRALAAKACETAECRRFLLAEIRRREREERAILLEQARQLRDELFEQVRAARDQRAEADRIGKPDTYSLVVIPSFSAAVTDVPAIRRNALRDHLTQWIAEAIADRSELSPPAPPASSAGAKQAVIGRACAQCRGNCCRNGSDHAYLSAGTVRRFIAAHPDLGPDDVLAAYLDRVSEKTHEHSCIYHGAKGCGLSAEMRSDTCNQYFCEGLKEFMQNVPDANRLRVFLTSAIDGVIQETTFLEESATSS